VLFHKPPRSSVTALLLSVSTQVSQLQFVLQLNIFISAEKKVDSGCQLTSSYSTAFRHLILDDVTPDTEQRKQQNECLADVMERKLAAISYHGERKQPS
jgi:hypothetical protein